ncbi:hypothetical protein CYMTET_10794 [Cymbomonas tetramitiformis]|uniref:beta-galactoside alpha-(2,6)-sialyltransferase n=1 Tax=Cymbomonas tetramitiformis TaxID=36881 RepID=A0AAE0LE45_9CHLO|nr:hypothetical protein CYMTET_10794 [Cymbomonas tetramitiformis]
MKMSEEQKTKVRAPNPSEWRFVDDEEFLNAFAQSELDDHGKKDLAPTQKTTRPSPKSGSQAAFLSRGFLLIVILIVGVYIVDLEEIAIVGERTKDTFTKIKPYWQTTEEIQERLTADGSAYQRHQIADALAAGGDPTGSEEEDVPSVPVTEAVEVEPPVVQEPEVPAKVIPEEPEEEPEVEPEVEPRETVAEETEPEAPVEVTEKPVMALQEADEFPEERVLEEPKVEMGLAGKKPSSSKKSSKKGGKTPKTDEEKAAAGPKPRGNVELGLWPPAQCTLMNPISSGPLLSEEAPVASGVEEEEEEGQRRHLLGEPATQLLVAKRPPDQKLKNEVYDYIMDFMGSPKGCIPRALEGVNVKCSGGGGGHSCRGQGLPFCNKTSSWKKPPKTPPLFPLTNLYVSSAGREEPGSWGSCAFLGVGDMLLKDQYGADIDSHDTVVRYNAPIKGYEAHVGTKTTLMWVKDKYKTTVKPTKGYIVASRKSYPNTYVPRTSELRVFRDNIYKLWFLARNIPEGKAAAGFARAVGLVKSGLCTSVSLYGMSTAAGRGSGKYFDKKAIVTKGHTIDWDGWLLKAMMDLGYLCVYGE